LRILGLDVGEVRIGVALSDETELIAQGLTTIERWSWKKDLQAIADLVQKHSVEQIVVGNPFNMDGSRGRQAGLIDEFVERLEECTPVPIALWDERLSSFSAEQVLIESGMQRSKRKGVIDKVAAVIILQHFLDHQHAARARAAEPEN
jgi:putative Holliday junction resolvase